MSKARPLAIDPGKWGLLAKYDDPTIRFLMDRKFPWLKRISNAPPPSKTVSDVRRLSAPVGSRQIVAGGRLTAAGQDDVDKYEHELHELSDGDLQQLVEREAVKAAEAAKIEYELGEKKLYAEWPTVDFSHWLRVALWNADEAVDLSLGKEPNKRFGWNYISTLLQISSFAKTYEKRRLLIFRAVQAGDLPNPMRPQQFRIWAAAQAIAVPNDLRLVATSAVPVQQPEAGTSSQPVTTAQTPPASGPSVTTHELESRSDDMTAVINLAVSKAADPNDTNSVWVALVALASSSTPQAPLVGCSEGEVKYYAGDEVKFLSKKNLADRLRRRRGHAR